VGCGPRPSQHPLGSSISMMKSMHSAFVVIIIFPCLPVDVLLHPSVGGREWPHPSKGGIGPTGRVWPSKAMVFVL
jgi:hypothetical protein